MPRARIVLFLCLVLLAVPCFADSLPEVHHVVGVVGDSTGALIVGATVEFGNGKYHVAAQTDSAGQFRLAIVSASSGTVSVRAAGFASLERPWNGEGQLNLVLQPQSVSQHVLVTATRISTPLDDSPADSVTLSREILATTPALALDDVLRKVPGFTLFRRSSSRTSNPGTQGVSMRGVGASGASRALVLVDEIPLIDPFGGWVYWDRVARESLSNVEVVRGGGGASLYGSTAMGGVIQFRTRQPETTSVSASGSWGNENTPQLSLWAGTRLGPWNASAATDLFRTDGFILVPEGQRGTVDTPANSRHELTTLDLGRHFGDSSRVFIRGSYFDEGRHNGTAIQTNATQIGDFATGWNYDSTRMGTVSARLFALFESYDQTFSAVQSVHSTRDFESLTNHQRVPSQALGGSAQWSRPVGRAQTLVAGFEMREVHGSSNENLFKQDVNNNTIPNGMNLSGGRERTARVFGEDILQLGPRLIANLSLGYDHWSDFGARRIHINADGTSSLTSYADRSSDALNPRASLLYRLGHGTSLTASGYRAFRAPTLNELYRSFRQGNAVTQNNPALRAERLTGVEGGVRQNLLGNRLNLRATFFWNDITNAIVNVTKSKDPQTGLITRQKLNVSRILSTGLNLDGEFRVTGNFQIAGGYQYTHAVVSSYTPPPEPVGLNPSLTGNWIPQVPHQQFTLQARYVNPKVITATVQGTFVGQQFDDDLNSLLLDRFFTVDLYLGRSLGHGLEVFGAAENVFNQRYNVALTPVPNLGPPVLARVGLRYQFPSR
jgi:outer membrane receptor protein involved in Fe transport